MITLVIVLVYISMDYTTMAKLKKKYYIIETEDEDVDKKDNAQDEGVDIKDKVKLSWYPFYRSRRPVRIQGRGLKNKNKNK